VYKNPEKREHKRIEKPFKARFKIRSDKTQEMESDDWDSITLKNLSAGGTYFFHKKDLGIGTLLDLKIEVPKSMLTINCVGRVIRSYKDQPTFMTAIKFIEIGEQEKELINKTSE
jgi:hypothetical protein